jgi:hypothetical protein
MKRSGHFGGIPATLVELGYKVQPVLDALQSGIGQPAAQELAADAALDAEFCTVVGKAMQLGGVDTVAVRAAFEAAGSADRRRLTDDLNDRGLAYFHDARALCRMAGALAAGPGVEPQWSAQASHRIKQLAWVQGLKRQVQEAALPPHLEAWATARTGAAHKHRHFWS